MLKHNYVPVSVTVSNLYLTTNPKLKTSPTESWLLLIIKSILKVSQSKCSVDNIDPLSNMND